MLARRCDILYGLRAAVHLGMQHRQLRRVRAVRQRLQAVAGMRELPRSVQIEVHGALREFV